MNMLKICIHILYILFFSAFFSCGSAGIEKNSVTVKNTTNSKDTSILGWVEGIFENVSNEGAYTEIWKKKSDSDYIGNGYFLVKKDTVFMMKMKLYKLNNTLKMNYYVKGQNDNKEVIFTLASKRANTYIFENPFKIFPSVMQYTFIGDSVIKVIERGFVGEKEKVREFTITKTKENFLF